MYNTNSSSFSKVVASENWVTEIEGMFKNEEVGETPVCIHKVRPVVRAIRPEAYAPQYISLGPYHHIRGELYEMQAYKPLATKKSQIGCQNNQETFERLTDLVISFKNKHIARVRASYDRQLKDEDYPLAWIMVVDSIFLLQFLLEHMDKNRSCLSRMKRTAHLVDRTDSAYHSILHDIMMLENQIPIFVLNDIIPFCNTANEVGLLPFMLLNTFKELCPLKYDVKNLIRPEITQYAHLLELQYFLIVPEPNKSSFRECKDDDTTEPIWTITTNEKRPRNCLPKINVLPPKLEMVGNIRVVRAVANSKPLKVIWKIASLVTVVLPSVTNLASLKRRGEEILTDPENAGVGSNSSNKEAPKMEQIEIPSASKLLHVGIKFCPTDGLISSIKFDKKTQTFHLPTINIDANTEVIIRNLVAYEAEAISGPAVLARYTELMNGFIDTAKDVKLLRQRKIIVSYLKNDEDVAQLWNNMSRSIRLSHVSFIDKAIKEVNEVYNSKIRVKFIRFTKECMVCGWRFLMLLLAIMLIVLMVIQSFCEVYNCPRALEPVAAPPGS